MSSGVSSLNNSSTDMSISDGHWHHVCFTWTSSTGQWQAYKDGTATSGKTGAKPVTITAIPGNKKCI